MTKLKPEIMSPIRDWTSLEAVKGYADAVYFGLPDLSLRAHANAITLSELPKFVARCHDYKIKAYLAVNAVVYDKDLKQAEKIFKQAKKAKVDAVIVWDLAAIELAKKYQLTIFISTQANVSNYRTAEFYKKLGAKRVVLARELTLEQIKDIRKHTKVELETFVHGAMCLAISGRCVLSSYLYGTSANCGVCAQPCRKEWVLTEPEGKQIVTEGKYFLSAKDLCMIEYIPELIKAGIQSFKIEGRRRDPQYIATTARCYKEAVDAYFAGTYTKEKIQQWRVELDKVYNRGYSTGFFFGDPGKEGIGYDKADNAALIRRTWVGTIVKYYDKIGVAEVLVKGDGLEVGVEMVVEGKNTYLKQSLTSMQSEHSEIKKATKNDLVAIKVTGPVKKGDSVFVLKNATAKAV